MRDGIFELDDDLDADLLGGPGVPGGTVFTL